MVDEMTAHEIKILRQIKKHLITVDGCFADKCSALDMIDQLINSKQVKST